MKKNKYFFSLAFLVTIGVLLITSCSDKLTKPDASFSVDKNSVTAGDTVTFTITGSGDMFTIWTGESKDKFGHTVDINTLIFKYRYTEEGTHTAKCIAINIDGMDAMYDSTSVEITVTPPPKK